MCKLTKARVAVILFVVLCVLPFPVWTLCGGSASVELENRKIAPLPKLRADTIRTFPKEFESYYNDRLPFRSDLIWANSMLDYAVFRTPSNAEIVLGNDGWLFYRTCVSQYLGHDLLSDAQLEQIARNMRAVKAYCDRRGISFTLFVAPNKERTHSDSIPVSYGRKAEYGRFEQVIDYIERNTDVPVIQPEAVLEEWRATHPEPVGYLADTHWNSLGGHIGASVLLEALGKEVPQSKRIDVTEPSYHDLANMLHLERSIDLGKDYVPVFEEAAIPTQNDFATHVTYENPNGVGRILVRRDSFCTAMHRTLSQPWAHYDAVKDGIFEWSMVEEQKPDVFVIEIVERELHTLAEMEVPQ